MTQVSHIENTANTFLQGLHYPFHHTHVYPGDEVHAFPLDKLAAYTKQPLQFFIDRMTPANGYVEGGRYIRNTTRVLKFEIRKPGSDQPVTKSWSNTSRIILTFDAAL